VHLDWWDRLVCRVRAEPPARPVSPVPTEQPVSLDQLELPANRDGLDIPDLLVCLVTGA
jgi:hypothetical protein